MPKFRSGLVQQGSARTLRVALLAIILAMALSACSTELGVKGSSVDVAFLAFSDANGTWGQPRPLDAATVSGTITVIVKAGTDVQMVSFFLDDVEMEGLPYIEVDAAPFSTALDTLDLEDGPHTLTVEVRGSVGSRLLLVRSTEFTVNNSVDLPDPEQPVPEQPEPEQPEPEQPEPEEPSGPPPVIPDEYPSPTYWVSTTGSDANNGRTAASAFRTIRKAASVVRPGDVVYIREGTYREYLGADLWTRSGLPGQPISIMGAPGESVVLDGSDRINDGTNPSHPKLIWLRDTDWYVFRNLTLKASAGRGIALEGDNHVIKDLIVQGSHAEGVFIRGSHNLVEDVVSFGNYTYTNEGESADGFKVVRGEANVLRRVVAYENSDDGIDLWDSTGTLVEYSIAFGNGAGSNGDGMGFKLSNGSQNNAGHTIRYNVSFRNRGYNFTDNGGGGLTMYHNTSFEAGYGRGFVARGRSGQTRHTLYNNLSFDRNGVMVNVQSGSTLPYQQSNSWNLGIGDPGFVSTNPSSEYFLRLASGSPAIDAGYDLGLHYAGAAPDLGAFEYGLAALLAAAIK